MTYLIRTLRNKPHVIAHLVHEVEGRVGVLCSQKARPAAGDRSLGGEWRLADALPQGVRLCQHCQKKQGKLDNPLPARVERELAQLALWDAHAAALQREKMLALYGQKRAANSGAKTKKRRKLL